MVADITINNYASAVQIDNLGGFDVDGAMFRIMMSGSPMNYSPGGLYSVFLAVNEDYNWEAYAGNNPIFGNGVRCMMACFGYSSVAEGILTRDPYSGYVSFMMHGAILKSFWNMGDFGDYMGDFPCVGGYRIPVAKIESLGFWNPTGSAFCPGTRFKVVVE